MTSFPPSLKTDPSNNFHSHAQYNHPRNNLSYSHPFNQLKTNPNSRGESIKMRSMGGGGKDNFALTITLPPSSLRLLKQTEPDHSLEFHDRGVIWPFDLDWDPDSEPETNNPHKFYHPNNSSFGLSAVFAEDRGLTVRRQARPIIGSGPDTMAKSAPVNVPTCHVRRRLDHAMDELEEKEMDDDDDKELVPPHVIVARSHVMRFSVFEGVGRTLKGRDLRRVRNAVFQQTGFLDL